jgi:hypothetical protein
LGGGHSAGNCTLQLNIHWDNKHNSLANLTDLRALSVDSLGRVPAWRCPVLHVRGNMYYAPILLSNPRMTNAGKWLRTHGLGCGRGGDGSSGGGFKGSGAEASGSRDEPFFAAISRHLFRPHSAAVERVTAAIERNRSVAVIGVHVRSTILLALHKDRRDAATKYGVLKTYGFLDCIEKVRNASLAAGYASSRVYVAADNPSVRLETTAALGERDVIPPPAFLYTGQERRGKMTTVRGAVATGGAVDEMLLLSRLDGLIVWDLKDSTYSAVAASWTAHRVGGQRVASASASQRPWMGVHTTSNACERLNDAQVEPPAHDKFTR